MKGYIAHAQSKPLQLVLESAASWSTLRRLTLDDLAYAC